MLIKHDNSKAVGLIPARGGSKELPGKNLRMLAAKPLLNYTIEAAKQAKYLSDVYVSSENPEIRKTAQQAGCTVIVRPQHLATDTALAVDVVKHFFATVPEVVEKNLIVVYLQPTSPFRTAAHIDHALAEMMQADAPGLVSVVEMTKSPYKSFQLDDQGRLKSLFNEAFSNLGRQVLPRTFVANGAIYAFRAEEFLERQGFPSDGSLPFVMSEQDSIDIDSPADFLRAEHMFGIRNVA